MEIKTIPSMIWVNEYNIKFKYETKRKNSKEQIRKITQIDKKTAERDFWLWIQNFNEEKPYRAMLNVEILSIDKVSGRYIEI